MTDDDPGQTAAMAQIVTSLRRAYRVDLEAPVPDHMQRLIDALQQGLDRSNLQQMP